MFLHIYTFLASFVPRLKIPWYHKKIFFTKYTSCFISFQSRVPKSGIKIPSRVTCSSHSLKSFLFKLIQFLFGIQYGSKIEVRLTFSWTKPRRSFQVGTFGNIETKVRLAKIVTPLKRTDINTKVEKCLQID